ncbi:MAG: hypothetical protein AAFY71_25365 [Bacteroidota bacterium]
MGSLINYSAMNKLISCLLIGSLPLTPKAQDLVIEDFFPTEDSRHKNAISAQARLYCDGETISLNVFVRDTDLQLSDINRQSDQVRIWLALPKEAYPEKFDYQLHPNYIMAPGYSKADKTRIFSTSSSDLPDTEPLNLEDLFEASDYPMNFRGETDTSGLPPRPQLSEHYLPYGLVGYSFFPDNREIEWVNEGDMEALENIFDLRFAYLPDSIQYVAEPSERGDGYILDISFPPAALGFVQLPKMNHIQLLIEILDAEKGKEAEVVLTSSENRIEEIPSTFNSVHFQEPLRTNFSSIPDQVFYQTSFYPTCVMADSNWVSTSLDVDALVFQPRKTSESLTELKFYRQNLEYLEQQYLNTAVETLRVQLDFVNQFPRQKEYTLVNGQTLSNEKTAYPLPDRNDLPSGLFAFPDGGIGIIQRNSIPVDPFGWSNCQTCLEEKVSIHRIDPSGQYELLRIFQGEGEFAYCKVEDLKFEEFFLDTMDWIIEGKILVLGLKHRYKKLRKRVKVSWNDDGLNMKVVEVD